jgi:NADH-quinone oxidoreductase subunit J
MPQFIFYLFALAALVSGSLVVLKRDPIISALFLIVTLCNVAGLYLFFGAGFLAAVQIIIYAGAVMVLFLFIVMLLPAGEAAEERWGKLKKGAAGVAAIFALELGSILATSLGWVGGQGLTEEGLAGVDMKVIGEALFGPFLIPLQIVAFLLLVAVMGVVILTAHAEGEGEVGLK